MNFPVTNLIEYKFFIFCLDKKIKNNVFFMPFNCIMWNPYIKVFFMFSITFIHKKYSQLLELRKLKKI